MISRALRHKFVIPEWPEFCDQIEDFYHICKDVEGGKVASYIPQLARFNPNHFAVSVCSTDGQRVSVGDTNVSFTMQSCRFVNRLILFVFNFELLKYFQ